MNRAIVAALGLCLVLPVSATQVSSQPGQRQQPFICQTEANGLGPALDADCNAKTLVQYYYRSSEKRAATAANPASALPEGLKPYDSSGTRPIDLAQVTLADGHKVDYIVRRELGVSNRSVYEILFLHSPDDPLPTPRARAAKGWNGRLVYAFGGGCRAGYRQGKLALFGLQAAASKLLEQGYALATSSLNILDNNCNETLSTETAAMVKAHFIKEYGKPDYTIGIGGSSGAASLYLTVQNHPGILDGIIPIYSQPDHITTEVPAFSDCALLEHVFKESKLPWTELQKTAVSGYVHWKACAIAASVLPQLGWLDPKGCDPSIPKEMIYDRVSNPKGVRCTYYDNEVDVFGRDPRTGAALRTLDNVGIQYGLVAFNAGKIDAEQFIELNARMGGYDRDGQITPARTIADPQALRMAYARGVLFTGKNLGDLPIIDWNPYTDDLDDLHTRDRSFITRARLIAANGDASNQVIFETPHAGDSYEKIIFKLTLLVPAMDRWLTRIKADRTVDPLRVKVLRNKPADLADGCITVEGERIVEAAAYDSGGRCNQLYPPHGNPRVAAGAPMIAEVLKCELKPIDAADYTHPLTQEQLERLKSIFPTGVCDFSKPGIGPPSTHEGNAG